MSEQTQMENRHAEWKEHAERCRGQSDASMRNGMMGLGQVATSTLAGVAAVAIAIAAIFG